jgi:hypothetical protein
LGTCLQAQVGVIPPDSPGLSHAEAPRHLLDSGQNLRTAPREASFSAIELSFGELGLYKAEATLILQDQVARESKSSGTVRSCAGVSDL